MCHRFFLANKNISYQALIKFTFPTSFEQVSGVFFRTFKKNLKFKIKKEKVAIHSLLN